MLNGNPPSIIPTSREMGGGRMEKEGGRREEGEGSPKILDLGVPGLNLGAPGLDLGVPGLASNSQSLNLSTTPLRGIGTCEISPLSF